MQSKFDIYCGLPEDLKIVTAETLSNRDLQGLSQTSTYHRTLLGPMLGIRKLLHYVTRGEYGAVRAMVRSDLSLLFKRGVATDCSERTFHHISAFEYALWALDKHMWTAMIGCIPHNQGGRAVFAQLLTQYQQMSAHGVTYTFKGETITERHFDFSNTIIKELQLYNDLVKAPLYESKAVENQWRKGVGSAQKLLPMHVVYEYCSDQDFNPTPNFISQPNKLSRRFFLDYESEYTEDWFSMDSKLGIEFAIQRSKLYPRGICVFERSHIPTDRVEDEIHAMKALCAVRTHDFNALKLQLEDQMILDKHYHSFLDLLAPSIRLIIEKKLDCFARAQAQSVSKQWFNFFHDHQFASGYYPKWRDRNFYELFNPKVGEGTFYLTRMGNEYRFYIQKRNDQYEGYTNIWVECQHFILNRGAITVIQIDELRPVDEYWMSENDFPEPPIKFDSFNSWGGPVGIASKAAKVDYVSLESFLEQFLNPRPAPSDLGWKPRNPIFKLRERPDYVTIPSLCEEYERKGLSYQ